MAVAYGVVPAYSALRPAVRVCDLLKGGDLLRETIISTDPDKVVTEGALVVLVDTYVNNFCLLNEVKNYHIKLAGKVTVGTTTWLHNLSPREPTPNESAKVNKILALAPPRLPNLRTGTSGMDHGV